MDSDISGISHIKNSHTLIFYWRNHQWKNLLKKN
jgi:hypothetical protein